MKTILLFFTAAVLFACKETGSVAESDTIAGNTAASPAPPACGNSLLAMDKSRLTTQWIDDHGYAICREDANFNISIIDLETIATKIGENNVPKWLSDNADMVHYFHSYPLIAESHRIKEPARNSHLSTVNLQSSMTIAELKAELDKLKPGAFESDRYGGYVILQKDPQDGSRIHVSISNFNPEASNYSFPYLKSIVLTQNLRPDSRIHLGEVLFPSTVPGAPGEKMIVLKVKNTYYNYSKEPSASLFPINF